MNNLNNLNPMNDSLHLVQRWDMFKGRKGAGGLSSSFSSEFLRGGNLQRARASLPKAKAVGPFGRSNKGISHTPPEAVW